MKEYELSGSIEINFFVECLGKLKLNKLKKAVKKVLEDYFEKNEAVSSSEIYSIEENFDYEVLE